MRIVVSFCRTVHIDKGLAAAYFCPDTPKNIQAARPQREALRYKPFLGRETMGRFFARSAEVHWSLFHDHRHQYKHGCVHCTHVQPADTAAYDRKKPLTRAKTPQYKYIQIIGKTCCFWHVSKKHAGGPVPLIAFFGSQLTSRQSSQGS